MDILDPRLFNLLPEHHTSNANNLWNCALFLTQLANSEQQMNGNNAAVTSNACNGMTGVSGHSISAPQIFPTTTTPSNHYHIENNNNNNNTNNSENNLLLLDSNEYLNLSSNLEEILARLLKLKRRNKASLFNLLIPSLSLTKQQQRKNDENFMDTQMRLLNESTPWWGGGGGGDCPYGGGGGSSSSFVTRSSGNKVLSNKTMTKTLPPPNSLNNSNCNSQSNSNCDDSSSEDEEGTVAAAVSASVGAEEESVESMEVKMRNFHNKIAYLNEDGSKR